jgi:hypothetical protein
MPQSRLVSPRIVRDDALDTAAVERFWTTAMR